MEKFQLDTHVRGHGEIKTHACPLCSRRYIWRKSMQTHICQVHGSARKSVTNVKDSKERTSPSGLTAPKLPRILPRIAQPYFCHLCPFVFKCSKDLDSHMALHLGERSYTCPICRKNFAWQSNLALHLFRRHGVRTDTEDTEKSPSGQLPPLLPKITSADSTAATSTHIAPLPPVMTGFLIFKNDPTATLQPAMITTDIGAASTGPTTMTPPQSENNCLMTAVDIKAETISPTTTTPAPMTTVDITAGTNCPTTMLLPSMTTTDIKAEPSSPTSMPTPNMTTVDIKTEPCSPAATPPPIMTGVDVDAELSSPATMLPYTLTLVDIKKEPSP